MGTVSNCC